MKILLKTMVLATACLAAFTQAEVVVGEESDGTANGSPTENVNVIEIAEPTWLDFQPSAPVDRLRPSVDSAGENRPSFQDAIGYFPSAQRDAINRFAKDAGVKLRIAIALPKRLMEGGPARKAFVKLSRPLNIPLRLTLSTYNLEQLSLPQYLVIPAGKTLGSYNLSAKNDRLVNLTREIITTVWMGDVLLAKLPVKITDDETPPKMKLVLPPSLVEGAPVREKNAVIILDRPVDVYFRVYLDADFSGKLEFFSDLMVPHGQKAYKFKIAAKNDNRIDGPFPVALTARCEGMKSIDGKITTLDNDIRVLTLGLPPTVPEGGTAVGTVKASGIMGHALKVALTNEHPEQIDLPSTVTIAEGESEVSFAIAGLDNTSRDGSRDVRITAATGDFTSSEGTTTVRDNEVVSYRFTGLDGIVNTSSPVAAGIFGTDVEGNDIGNFSGTVNLELILPDGSLQQMDPATVALNGTAGWVGNLAIPVLASAPLKVRATDAAGNSGESAPCDVMRVLPMTAQNLVWDATRGRLFASATKFAGALYDNQVIAINPETMQITGSGRSNINPGELAITSGGEFLYQSCKSNGFIYKFNPDTLDTLSMFPVGTDSDSRTLYPTDMCTVEGQPETVIVSRSYGGSISYIHHSVAAYGSGVILPGTTNVYPFIRNHVIEPSGDPAIFFGYDNQSSGHDFSRLKLDASGISVVQKKEGLLGGGVTDMCSLGNKVFSNFGVAVDGENMKRIGILDTRGLAVADTAANRVVYLEKGPAVSDNYRSIAVFDPSSTDLIRRLDLPFPAVAPLGFVRWGGNGLAYCDGGKVVLINSTRLMPSDPPTDLVTTVKTGPGAATLGDPLTYTVEVTNSGQNPAKNVRLSARFKGSLIIRNVSSSSGTRTRDGLSAELLVGDLAPDATATLTITVIPQAPDVLIGTANVGSSSEDPDYTNNTDLAITSVGFNGATDVFNQINLVTNNIVVDPKRDLLWLSIPSSVTAPLGRSVVSIDPRTGVISERIRLGAEPFTDSMALSPNGRYLYVGLSDVSEIHRIDLETGGYPGLRIPLELSRWSKANHAQDIEVLDGDGTGFLMVGSNDHAASVYDGTVMRPERTSVYSVDRIERSATPGVFIGYDNSDSGHGFTRLSIAPAGVSVSQIVSGTYGGFSADIHNDGNLLLFSTGELVDSSNLTLKANLPFFGLPCADEANQRVYLANEGWLRGFDAVTGAMLGSLPIPAPGVQVFFQNSQRCLRWGADGFAMTGKEGNLYIARWSLAARAAAASQVTFASRAVLNNPATSDPDGDGIPNAFENLFGTSPSQFSSNPIRLASATAGDQSVIHLHFPRRVGIAMPAYGYEFSSDLAVWVPIESVSESVISTQAVDGVEVEHLDATIIVPQSKSGFVRLRWLQP